MAKPWVFVGEGRHRRVFRRNNVVIKIPLNEEGIDANRREAYIYTCRDSSGYSYCKYAKCRLIKDTDILMMEWAHYPREGITDERGYIPYKDMPDWAWRVDLFQVGYNRKGKAVTYDYGG